MLHEFKCQDVDGESRLKADLEIVCWQPTHKLFAYMVAMPALIVWGLGLPLMIVWLMARRSGDLASEEARESYGFLYGGYKSDFYFWEVLIIFRKVILIFICVFVTGYGVLTQALILLLVLVSFLVITARKRPHITEALFDLEALSLATAMLTVYCGLFFVADTSEERSGVITSADRSSDVTFSLGSNTRTFLVAAIVGTNVCFLLVWLWRVCSELEGLRGFILRTCPGLYLPVFACGDRDRAYLDRQKQMVLDDNE
jgi:hypothetical protein